MKSFFNIDIIEINGLKDMMKKCKENDEWFEINAESAGLLYDYIDSIERSYKCLYDEQEK